MLKSSASCANSADDLEADHFQAFHRLIYQHFFDMIDDFFPIHHAICTHVDGLNWTADLRFHLIEIEAYLRLQQYDIRVFALCPPPVSAWPSTGRMAVRPVGAADGSGGHVHLIYPFFKIVDKKRWLR